MYVLVSRSITLDQHRQFLCGNRGLTFNSSEKEVNVKKNSSVRDTIPQLWIISTVLKSLDLSVPVITNDMCVCQDVYRVCVVYS